jgi:hypothetical protein
MPPWFSKEPPWVITLDCSTLSIHEEDIFHITLQKEELIKTREQFPFWKNADFFNIEL